MGVTIHWDFVRSESPEKLLKRAEKVAKELGFKIEERGWNKLIINPDEESEWICLHFHKAKTIKRRVGYDLEKEKMSRKEVYKDDWFTGGFTKTHYAGPEVHIKVAEFLRFIASNCEEAKVHDEAHYYENGFDKKFIEKLKAYWDDYNKMIGNLAGQLKKAFGKDNVLCSGDLK